MLKNYFTDFGLNSQDNFEKDFGDIKFGPQKKDTIELVWTLLIYVFLCLGIFLRRTVNFPDPVPGVNTSVFKFGIIAASFIIGLAVLAPLLRIISKFHKGKLSWQHCLTAFSIGFFGDLTFNLIINSFVSVMK